MSGNEERDKRDVITLDRERYENLLIELGELRKLSELMQEYKVALQEKESELRGKEHEIEELKEILLEVEWKDYELDQTLKELKELQAEVERLKNSRAWWRKILG